MPIRVHIIGSGLAGLALANALLHDPQHRYEVTVFERDDTGFSSERGGYQIRLGEDGITGLRGCLDAQSYSELAAVWGQELSRAPSLVDPISLRPIVHLNDLKLYPKSRAVPRQALKEYLLRVPTQRKAVQWDRTLVDCVKSFSGDTTEWICKFEDGFESVCDIVIAADGSRSKVNQIFKIDNKTIMPKGVIQGRCAIPNDVYNQLPETLRQRGSIMFLTRGIAGFCAVYELKAQNDAESDDSESFLFWGLNLEGEEMNKARKLPDSESRVNFTLDHLKSRGCEESGIPTIVKLGRQNVRCGPVSSSTPPVNWRKGDTSLGRIIFIGDSIHAMTPGRGQGANQALKDASVLAKYMLEFDSSSPTTDDRISLMAESFDKEMYKRAFGWVKASEEATNIDTSSTKGYYGVKVLQAALIAAGIVVSAAESIGLKQPADISF